MTSKIAVIKCLRSHIGLGVKECADIVDYINRMPLQDYLKIKALANELKENNISCEIINIDNPINY